MYVRTFAPHYVATAAAGTCLVTGASSGIGAEIARTLARRGFGVTLIAHREARLRELADELAPTGIRVEVIAADLTDPAERRRLAEAVAGRGPAVDVLT
ncbi:MULTISPECIES: SDR family oxidoreductase [unclassified Mycobacterium]|uniref:SDR family NAD(P)-dependent oxidoreductase n=1 Tax=unclassified Mycobacterium TaxID=2642494 RepID=UPI0009EE0005|nr:MULTISPECIES: SDR family NAD(P)-dependent oxidoreductase [unclassified Mycobacterium]